MKDTILDIISLNDIMVLVEASHKQENEVVKQSMQTLRVSLLLLLTFYLMENSVSLRRSSRQFTWKPTVEENGGKTAT